MSTKQHGRHPVSQPPMSATTRARLLTQMQSGRDETLPEYLFSITHTDLLLAIAGGLIDPVAIARRTLADRGLDQDGQWVGFEEAARIHGVTR
jgi:hypothetical protein